MTASGEFQLDCVPVGRVHLRVGERESLENGGFLRELEIDVVPGDNPPVEIRF